MIRSRDFSVRKLGRLMVEHEDEVIKETLTRMNAEELSELQMKLSGQFRIDDTLVTIDDFDGLSKTSVEQVIKDTDHFFDATAFVTSKARQPEWTRDADVDAKTGEKFLQCLDGETIRCDEVKVAFKEVIEEALMTMDTREQGTGSGPGKSTKCSTSSNT